MIDNVMKEISVLTCLDTLTLSIVNGDYDNNCYVGFVSYLLHFNSINAEYIDYFYYGG